jgi:hypothetical protein
MLTVLIDIYCMPFSHLAVHGLSLAHRLGLGARNQQDVHPVHQSSGHIIEQNKEMSPKSRSHTVIDQNKNMSPNSRHIIEQNKNMSRKFRSCNWTKQEYVTEIQVT